MIVVSYSRIQNSFHSENVDSYVKGNLMDIMRDKLVGCDYRMIGIADSPEKEIDLVTRFKYLRENAIDEEFYEEVSEIKFINKMGASNGQG